LTIADKAPGHKKADAQQKGMELLKLVGLAEKAHSFVDDSRRTEAACGYCSLHAMEPKFSYLMNPPRTRPTMVSEVLAVIRRLAREE